MADADEGDDGTREVSPPVSTPSDGEDTRAVGRPVSVTADAGGSLDDPSSREELVADRYTVTRRLGEGGMGVVYLADDTRLERQVALKVLKRKRGAKADPQALARLLREAQALARLSHPHVVPVYDVLWEDEELIVAMEYVPGSALSSWLKRSPDWREILDAFVQAARGLAAAHDAGLVHRDFKPDNAIRGEGGRVRVLDFGLARVFGSGSGSGTDTGDDDARAPSFGSAPSGQTGDELTDAGVVLGTPMYMSPEQLYGREVGPPSDQYNFCVALYRALYRHPPFAGMSVEEVAANKNASRVLDPPADTPVPPSVLQVVRQGLHAEASRRFASMTALTGDLERAVSPRHRRWPLVAGGLAVVGMATWWAMTQRERCPDPLPRLAEVWTEAMRDDLATTLRAVPASFAGATSERVVTQLDGYATQWLAAAQRACEAPDGPEANDVRDCLRARLDRLERTVDVLGAIADADGLRAALDVTATLPPIAGCEDAEVLAREALPEDPTQRANAMTIRRQLAEADAHRAAGRLDPAIAGTRVALAEAEALAFEPVRLEASLLLGRLLAADLQFEEAEKILETTAHEATAAGANAIATGAATQLVSLLGGYLERIDDGLAWARHGEASVQRGGVDPMRHAALLARTGGVLVGAAKYDEARTKLDAALEITRAQVGEDHPSMASLLYDLGALESARGKFDRAIELYQRALAWDEAHFGPEHPAVASVLSGLGKAEFARNDHDKAAEYFRRSIDIKESAFGPNHPTLITVVTNLAAIQRIRQNYEDSAKLYARALAIAEKEYGEDHDQVAKVLVNYGGLQYVQGKYPEARRLFERSLSITERTLGPDHPSVATVSNNLGLLYDTIGERELAIATLTRALEVRRKILPPTHPMLGFSLVNLEQSYNRKGDHAAGAGFGTEAIEVFSKARKPDDPDLAYALTVHGENRLLADAPAEAEPLLSRAVEIYVAAKFDAASTSRARFAWAKAIWANGGGRTAARKQARTARDGYASAGETLYAAELRDIDAWLAAPS